MGQKNRERRAAKKRRDQSRQRPLASARRTRPPPGWDRPPPTAADLVVAAVHAHECRHDDYPALVAALAARPVEARAALDQALARIVAVLWDDGWAPVDAVRVIEHTCSAAHAAVAADAVCADGQRRRDRDERLHPRWVDQLDALGHRRPSPSDRSRTDAQDVALAVEVLARWSHVPAIPPTIPAPGTAHWAGGPQADHGMDARILDRVHALLAKAESTEFVEESEALTAKAQELIARHAIQDALLRRGARDTRPSVRNVVVGNPYAHPKALLLAEIAAANRCRATWSEDLGWSTVFGYDGDLDAVELLFASLLTQATSALARSGSRRDRVGRSRTTSFRRSFLFGFGYRIGQRLRDATRSEVVSADRDSGGALVPVLAARDEHVRDAQESAFPHLVHLSPAVGNAGGWVAGQAAAELASLDPSSGALTGSRAG